MQTPVPPNKSDGSLDAERFVQYSPEVGEWAGWLEVDGTVTGFVTLSGEIWRPSQPDGDGGWQPIPNGEHPSQRPSNRSVAWNLARAALMRAFAAEHGASPGLNYYQSSNAAAVLSLALKAMRWPKACGPSTAKIIGHLCFMIEIAAKEVAAADCEPLSLRFKWAEATAGNDFPQWLLAAMEPENGTPGPVRRAGRFLDVETRRGVKPVGEGDVIVKLDDGSFDVLKAKAIARGGCLENVLVEHGQRSRQGETGECA